MKTTTERDEHGQVTRRTYWRGTTFRLGVEIDFEAYDREGCFRTSASVKLIAGQTRRGNDIVFTGTFLWAIQEGSLYSLETYEDKELTEPQRRWIEKVEDKLTDECIKRDEERLLKIIEQK